MSTVDALRRAIEILERQVKGASMAQVVAAKDVTHALAALVGVSDLAPADVDKMSSFMQADGAQAPDAPVYESKSGNIVDTLSDLLDKADAQLDDLRQRETENKQSFELTEQALADEINEAKKDLKNAKKTVAVAGERKAAAKGDLANTQKELDSDVTGLEEVRHECMEKAADFEAETKTRSEELNALAMAKKALVDNTAGAERQTYGFDQVSFLQTSNFRVVKVVRDLARKQGSTELAQLAIRIDDAVNSEVGNDGFGKVKGMIRDMLARLQKEASADAEKHAFCEKELAETKAKKEEGEAKLEKVSTQIDKNSAQSRQLKEDIAALQNGLSKLTRSQAEMDKIRVEEAAQYKGNKAEMEQGLQGVRVALRVLTEYYGQADEQSSKGAGNSIIGLLEVVESDLTKGLAEMTATEEAAIAAYDTETKENKVEKTAKEQDVEYKSKEATQLDQTGSEDAADKQGVQAELDAVLEYLSEIQKQCIAQAESFESRQKRFQAELDGLKEAHRILEEDVALVQKTSVRRFFRGNRAVHLSAA